MNQTTTIREIAQVLGVDHKTVCYQRDQYGMPVDSLIAACQWWVKHKRLTAPYWRTVETKHRAKAFLAGTAPGG